MFCECRLRNRAAHLEARRDDAHGMDPVKDLVIHGAIQTNLLDACNVKHT